MQFTCKIAMHVVNKSVEYTFIKSRDNPNGTMVILTFIIGTYKRY